MTNEQQIDLAIQRLRNPYHVATTGHGASDPEMQEMPLSRVNQEEIADVIETLQRERDEYAAKLVSAVNIACEIEKRLERERDEARAAYCKLFDLSVRGETDEIRERFDDRPEWRKGGDHAT